MESNLAPHLVSEASPVGTGTSFFSWDNKPLVIGAVAAATMIIDRVAIRPVSRWLAVKIDNLRTKKS